VHQPSSRRPISVLHHFLVAVQILSPRRNSFVWIYGHEYRPSAGVNIISLVTKAESMEQARFGDMRQMQNIVYSNIIIGGRQWNKFVFVANFVERPVRCLNQRRDCAFLFTCTIFLSTEVLHNGARKEKVAGGVEDSICLRRKGPSQVPSCLSWSLRWSFRTIDAIC